MELWWALRELTCGAVDLLLEDAHTIKVKGPCLFGSHDTFSMRCGLVPQLLEHALSVALRVDDGR